MTSRAFWLAAGVLLVMALAGLFLFQGEWIALALPLAVYLTLGWLERPTSPTLSAARDLSTDRITEGLPITQSLTVTNNGSSLPEVDMRDAFPPGLSLISGEPWHVLHLPTGGTINVEYALSGVRGRYFLPPVRGMARDSFGLFEKPFTLAAHAMLLVYPRVTDLPPLPIRPPQTKGFSGPIPSRRRGAGQDFLGVREYQLGDSLRRINWRVSARHDAELYANEFELDRVADVCLIVDARPHADQRVRGRRLLDYSVDATAGLAQGFLSAGHCVSVLVYGAGITRVYPGYGKHQLEKIMRVLAAADSGVNYAFETLRNLPVQLLPANGQVVYVGPLVPADLDLLVQLRASGYAVLVVSPDPLHAERLEAPDPESADFILAERLARVERAMLLQRLSRAGVQTVRWRVDQPIAPALEQTARTLKLSRQALEARR